MTASRACLNPWSASIALTVSSVCFTFGHCFRAHASSEFYCASVFQLNPEISYEPHPQSHLEQQVHQFNKLLIDSQSDKFSPSERQSRLTDAQRILIELTEAHPEIAELIQDEWRKLHSTSEHAVEAKRQRVISEIQALKHQLLTLKGQSWQIVEWEIEKDSNSDPIVKTEVTNLLRNQTELRNPDGLLRVRDWRHISVSQIGGPNEFDARGPGGHEGDVWGAKILSGRRIISWSSDHTLVIWRPTNNTYIVDQRIGVGWGKDPNSGHVFYVTGVQLCCDFKVLSWSGDQTLILWKLVNDTYVIDKRIGELENKDPQRGHIDSIVGGQVLPDGRVLSWSKDRTLIVWKLVDDTYVVDKRLGEVWDPDPRIGVNQSPDPNKGHTHWVNGAQVLSDGRVLSWSSDNTLILWTLVNDTYVITRRLGDVENTDPSKGHIRGVSAANALPDGRILSIDDSNRSLLWRPTYPIAIQTQIDTLSRELNSLKASLNRLESQRASTDIDRTGGER